MNSMTDGLRASHFAPSQEPQSIPLPFHPGRNVGQRNADVAMSLTTPIETNSALRLVARATSANRRFSLHDMLSASPIPEAEDVSDTVAIVEEDASTREHISDALRGMNIKVELFNSPLEFLLNRFSVVPLCLIANVRYQTMSGLEIQQLLHRFHWPTSVVFIAKNTDLPSAIRAMQHGAVDVVSEPLATSRLVEAVSLAVATAQTRCNHDQSISNFEQRVSTLTPREAEVMMLVTQGLLNKQIADALGISIITAKLHRGRMMKKMQSPRVPQLVRIVDALANAGVKLPNALPVCDMQADEMLSTS